MNFYAAILLLLLGATNVESKFVHSPYATINENRGSTTAAQSPYATINDNRGSTTVVRRKLSKKNKDVAKDIAKSIEGLYYYLGSCASMHKVTIKCGTFGNPNNIDSDLCIFEEYKVGVIMAEEEGEIPDDAVALGDRTFLVLQEGTYDTEEDGNNYEKEGKDIDPNEVCVLSGSFRRSSTVVVNKGSPTGLLPIPLAKSNGCNKPIQSCCANVDTQNFQFVVKANISDDGNLDIKFSSNYGVTYYTDNTSTSTESLTELNKVLYVAQKDVATEGRRLVTFCGILFGAAAVTVIFGGAASIGIWNHYCRTNSF